MNDPQIARILQGLRSNRLEQAWTEFLQDYSPLILQVIRSFERDPDHVSDCFLFVCEQLSRHGFRRLRRFRPEGPARFSTWLRAVVRNLCFDWHRQEFGRERVFQSIARLSTLDQEVFRCLYEGGATAEAAFLRLRPRFPQLTREQVGESKDRIEGSLTPRQRWVLSVRAFRTESASFEQPEEEGAAQGEIPDFRPDPETDAISEEKRTSLAKALSRLPARDRLLVRLRYEQDLTLAQIARLLGLGDPQSADRLLRKVLDRLREQLK